MLVVAIDNMAEREGFEPPEGYPSTVFKTAAFDHSATSPRAENIADIGAKMCSLLATVTAQVRDCVCRSSFAFAGCWKIFRATKSLRKREIVVPRGIAGIIGTQ